MKRHQNMYSTYLMDIVTCWLILMLKICLVENHNLKTISHTLMVLNKVKFLNHGIFLSLTHSNQGTHFEN